MTQQVNYPYGIRLEYENGLPRVEVRTRAHEISVFQQTHSSDSKPFEIQYVIKQGKIVQSTSSVSIDSADQGHLSRKRLAVVGPIWSIMMKPIKQREEALTLGYSLQGGGLEAGFKYMREVSPFADDRSMEHFQAVYPWLEEHRLYGGNLWIAVYGDSQDDEGLSPVQARIYRQDESSTNPYTPPSPLRGLDQASSGLYTQRAIDSFFEHAKSVVQL